MNGAAPPASGADGQPSVSTLVRMRIDDARNIGQREGYRLGYVSGYHYGVFSGAMCGAAAMGVVLGAAHLLGWLS